MTVELQHRASAESANDAGPTSTDAVPGSTEAPQPIRVTSLARLSPLVVFAITSLLTLAMVMEINARIRSENAVAADGVSDVLARDMESRIAIYSEALIGMQGFFESSDGVSRSEFNRYIETTRIFGRFPGIQALEWAPIVYREDLAEYEDLVRSDTSVNGVGYPDFEVHPTSEHDDLFVVDYLYPYEGNAAAVGFDLGSNPVRRAAVESAQDSGTPVATGPITLVQEEGSQSGMLLLVPVYERTVEDVEGRRASFVGLVLAVFRIGDLLEGASTQDDIRYSVFDAGDAGNPPGDDKERTLVFSEADADLASNETNLAIDVAGRRWEIAIDEKSMAQAGHFGTAFVAIAGMLAALAATAATVVVVRSQARAETYVYACTRELREANVDMRRSYADLEKFAYVASHDLQTPIRNVRNIVELLREGLPEDLNQDSVDLLDYITQSAQRMEELIKGLLEFSLIQRSDELELENVDLGSVLDGVIARATMNIDASAITIEHSGLPTVRGNTQLLGQVLENLVSNAIKYRLEDRHFHLTISAKRQGSNWLISFADNGIGIDSRFHDRIFEMFRRLHPAGEYDGTGIGLALCRRIIQHHGGEIWVESEPGAGSTFIFTIGAQA